MSADRELYINSQVGGIQVGETLTGYSAITQRWLHLLLVGHHLRGSPVYVTGVRVIYSLLRSSLGAALAGQSGFNRT